MTLQYVNPACAKALNYSAPGELVGRHVDEALTSDKNLIDIYSKIQQQLQSGQVRYIRTLLSSLSHARSVGQNRADQIDKIEYNTFYFLTVQWNTRTLPTAHTCAKANLVSILSPYLESVYPKLWIQTSDPDDLLVQSYICGKIFMKNFGRGKNTPVVFPKLRTNARR